MKRSDPQWARPLWSDRVAVLVGQGRYAKVLNLLGKIIYNQQLVLFKEEGEAERHWAWLYRIGLLRDLGRHHEALAWACLECDLNPSNPAAISLRDELKQALGYLRPDDPTRQATTVVPRSNWQGVAGMRELKAILERDVIHPLRRPELYKRYGLTLPNGILMYGPPGCGKTHIARALSRAVDYTFKEVGPSDLASIYVHGSQQMIGALFQEAAENAPCILFLDELDAFVPKRGGLDVGYHYSAEVNEFLVQLNRCADRGILIIGATNRMDSIDPAMLRPGRLDKKVFVGPPDPEARGEVFRLYLHGRPLGSDIDTRHLAMASPWYSYAELEHVVNEAARQALAEGADITQHHLLQALHGNPPALDRDNIKEYQAHGERLGSLREE